MIAPRPYQGIAMDVLHENIQKKDVLLLQAATGSGKTFLIVRMIQKYYNEHPNRNFLILMHKKELIMQFVDAFEKFTDIDMDDIAVVCAGLKKDKGKNNYNLDAPIIVASVQTFINQLNKYPGADLLVIDETHRAGYEKNDSQYQNVLETLREYKPNHKTIGVTATAYRLNHGYIYGDKCRPGRENFFPELTHRITYRELVEQKYLMPLKGYVAINKEAENEISTIKTAGGEYVMHEAGQVMSRHVESAVDAYEQYGKEHKSVAVFACTIAHAQFLNEAFKDRGYSSVLIHSKLAPSVREQNLKKWRSGEAQFAISVNILIEGFDFPGLSCLIMCRPTKSPVVFIQAIGRILRIAEGKKEALLIDCTGNVQNFGTDLDNPKFALPGTVEGEGDDSPEKICPGVKDDGEVCGERLHVAVLVCDECGFEFTKELVDKELGIMKKVEFDQGQEPEWHVIKDMTAFIHETNADKKLLRVKLETTTPDTGYYNKYVSVWFCFKDFYTGYAIDMGKERWKEFTWENYPDNVEEAEFMIPSLMQPTSVLCREDENGYLNALEFSFAPPDMQAQAEQENDDVPF